MQYPWNPNGSEDAVAAICSEDGRHLAMMPHSDRSPSTAVDDRFCSPETAVAGRSFRGNGRTIPGIGTLRTVAPHGRGCSRTPIHGYAKLAATK